MLRFEVGNTYINGISFVLPKIHKRGLLHIEYSLLTFDKPTYKMLL
jgi:hypothetical protein